MKVKNIISSLLVFSSMTMHAQRIVCDDTCKLADAEPFTENQRTGDKTAVQETEYAVISGNGGCGLCTPKETGQNGYIRISSYRTVLPLISFSAVMTVLVENVIYLLYFCMMYSAR